MSKTRYINTKFWSDPWIVDNLNPLDRHLFFYFLTNEHTTIAGVYEISLRTISNEIGLDKDEVVRMLKRLEPKIRYVDGWVIVVNQISHQNYKSPKIKTGIELVLERVPAELIDFIKFPADFNAEKYKTNKQTKLITDDLPSGEFNNSTPDAYGMDTLSHSKAKVKSKPNATSSLPSHVKKTGDKSQNRSTGPGHKSARTVADILKKKNYRKKSDEK